VWNTTSIVGPIRESRIDRFDRLDDGIVFRELVAAGFLGIDELVVDFDVKDSAAAFDERGVDVDCFLDCCRQTGGLWEVVSSAAVFDRYVHWLSLGEVVLRLIQAEVWRKLARPTAVV